MPSYLGGIESEVMQEWRRKSQNVLYQSDPEAWLWDVLGRKWWSSQREIAHSFVDNTFTIVKSANGVGKTMLAADLVAWFASVFPPQETSVLVSAPVRTQIDEVMMRYLREIHQVAEQRGNKLRGHISKWPKWLVDTPYDIDLVVPKRPADQNLLSSFQGIHNGHVAVVLDEAGGLQGDFYMGANAVTTNEHARILAIGNPDMRNTAFHERFRSQTERDRPMPADWEPAELDLKSGNFYRRDDGQWMEFGDKHRDWHRFTIGANDTPNFTGEIIYPDDPERDAEVKSKLVKVSWAQMMRRSASPGTIAAKVDGEFPTTDESTFFSQTIINRAWETFSTMFERERERLDAGIHDGFKYLGVDTGFSGGDKNVMYLNDNGRIYKVDQWDISDGEAEVEEMAIARRVHRKAQDLGVTQVRIDASGTSRGVHSNLKTEREFLNRNYILIGVKGAGSTPDSAKWVNARAWHYDTFRIAMGAGTIGLDPTDQDLRTDIEAMSFKYTQRMQLQMTSKEDLKKELKHSPDHLDAAIYSMIDFSGFTDGDGAGLNPGDVVLEDYDFDDRDMAGMPI